MQTGNHWRVARLGQGFMVFLAALAGRIAMGQMPNSTVLENKVMRLVFGNDPVPYLKEMSHRGGDTLLVAEQEANSLFRISLRKADGTTETLAGNQAGRAAITIPAAEKSRSVSMEFAEFPNTALRVSIRVELDTDPALSCWSIRIENPDRLELTAVSFPRLNAVPQIGSTGTDDVIVMPAYPGALAVNPGECWSVNSGKELRYPGDMSAQFLAYQDRSAGLFFASRDGGSHPRKLGVWRRADTFEFAHSYELDGDAAAEWECPYPVVLGVTQGTWQDSADLYKRWAVQQSWCARPLTRRDDIPDWFKAGPLIYVCAVRTYAADRTVSGSYYPKYLEHLNYLREKVDGPIVPMLASWENHRRWTGGDYFPIFDQEQAVPVIARMRAEGYRPFFFLSGLFFTFDNQGVNGGTIPAAEEHLDSYVIDQATGKPAVYTLNESSGKTDWKRNSYAICVGADFAKPFFRNVIDRAREVGVDVLQMDQTTSGGGYACSSTAHNHRPGPGCYQTHDFHALLDDMRTYGKSHTPDFVLFHEEPHEELISHLDGFHVREYKEKWWYRSQPGAIGIPLFTYLYHEYSIGYGGDSTPIGARNQLWNARCHAVNLVTGKTPGISVWSNPQQLFDSHPAPLTMVRNHCRLLKTRAVRFLMLGRMLHPYELDVPSQVYRVWTNSGGKGHTEDFSEASVLTSSWLDPDGNVGHIFVNPGEEARTVSLQLDTRNAPESPVANVEIWRSTADGDFQPLWQQAQLPKPLELELAPLEVVCIEIQPGK